MGTYLRGANLPVIHERDELQLVEDYACPIAQFDQDERHNAVRVRAL